MNLGYQAKKWNKEKIMMESNSWISKVEFYQVSTSFDFNKMIRAVSYIKATGFCNPKFPISAHEVG